MTLAERRRYLRKLWAKANEEEIQRLGVLQANQNKLPEELTKLLAESAIERPIIPRIVINSEVDGDENDDHNLRPPSLSLGSPATPFSATSYENTPVSTNFHWSTTTAGSPYFENSSMSSPSIRNAGPLSPSSPVSYIVSHDDSSYSHDSEADILVDKFNTCVWTGKFFWYLLMTVYHSYTGTC